MTIDVKNTWGGVSYETPLVKSLDILIEGVLCGSLTGDNENYGGDPFFNGDSNNPIF